MPYHIEAQYNHGTHKPCSSSKSTYIFHVQLFIVIDEILLNPLCRKMNSLGSSEEWARPTMYVSILYQAINALIALACTSLEFVVYIS